MNPLLPSDLSLLDHLAQDIGPSDPELASWFTSYARSHRKRLAQDLELARQWTGPEWRILEVGSAPLLLTAALKTEGFAVTGVDIDPSRFHEAITKLELDVVGCNIETESLPFADGTFDCVLFNELFEHLRINPVQTMAEVRRVLRPEGLLMLSTPNLYSYRGLVNLIFKQRSWSVGADPLTEYEKLATLGHMGHVREYTAGEVIGFLAGCGFRVRRVVHRGAPQTRTERAVTGLCPSLLPYVSVIATRDA